MQRTHLRVTQAGLISLATTIVGGLITVVPAWASDKQVILGALTAVISAAFLVANSVHALAASNVSAKDVEAGAVNAAKDEIGKVDFNKLAHDAIASQSLPDLEARVKSEAQAAVNALLARLSTPEATAPPAPPAPVA